MAFLSIMNVGLRANAASYSETQYLGLEALYNATDGERWIQSSGWRNTTLGVCSGWYGVTCDNAGNVTSLSLAGNGLSGNLTGAAEMYDVSSLEDIDLSDNGLTGAVPLGLGLMPQLEVVDLSWNDLSSFPSAWGSGALSLQHLYLHHNNISG